MIRLTSYSRYEHPFPLTYFRNVWDNYSELLRHLPEDKYYVQNSSGSHCGPNRSSFSLTPRKLDGLPADLGAFWSSVREALCAPELRDRFESMFGVRLDHPFATLVRDRQGHYIDVHPDWNVKVLTAQFYLPAGRHLRYHGTSVHDKDKGFVRTLDFLPNTGYAFVRSDVSYHSLRELPDVVRDTIMLTYHREPYDEY